VKSDLLQLELKSDVCGHDDKETICVLAAGSIGGCRELRQMGRHVFVCRSVVFDEGELEGTAVIGTTCKVLLLTVSGKQTSTARCVLFRATCLGIRCYFLPSILLESALVLTDNLFVNLIQWTDKTHKQFKKINTKKVSL
jgi:hypothetical protein